MDIVEQLAEQRIREALEAGEFDALPGVGRPLELDDNSLVPEELRAAYRLLKNSGFLPPELALRKQIQAAEELLLSVEDDTERCRARARLDLLRMQLDSRRGGQGSLLAAEYQYALTRKLAR